MAAFVEAQAELEGKKTKKKKKKKKKQVGDQLAELEQMMAQLEQGEGEMDLETAAATLKMLEEYDKNSMDANLINTIIYTVAAVFTYKEGHEFTVRGNLPKDNVDPAWKLRLKKTKTRLRKEIDILRDFMALLSENGGAGLMNKLPGLNTAIFIRL